MMKSTVMIFGYSDKPERYSNMAALLLKEYGYDIIPINPRIPSDLLLLSKECHTLTLYVNPDFQQKYLGELEKINAKRVIFNPGTENPTLIEIYNRLNIEVVIGCTLVMLRTNQF